MGEAGPEGEDVDERLWNDEDRQGEQQGQVQAGGVGWGETALLGRQSRRLCRISAGAAGPGGAHAHAPCPPFPAVPQEQEGPDDTSVPVGDKSQLDYAAGGEEDEEPAGKEGKEQPQAQQAQEERGEEEAAQQPGVEEEQEEEELGDYQDRWVGV